jgi:hypothetical protein
MLRTICDICCLKSALLETLLLGADATARTTRNSVPMMIYFMLVFGRLD